MIAAVPVPETAGCIELKHLGEALDALTRSPGPAVVLASGDPGFFGILRALRARGIGEPAATLAAESGATVFGIAFTQWIRDGETRSLAEIASDVLRELLNLTGAAAPHRSGDRVTAVPITRLRG